MYIEQWTQIEYKRSYRDLLATQCTRLLLVQYSNLSFTVWPARAYISKHFTTETLTLSCSISNGSTFCYDEVKIAGFAEAVFSKLQAWSRTWQSFHKVRNCLYSYCGSNTIITIAQVWKSLNSVRSWKTWSDLQESITTNISLYVFGVSHEYIMIFHKLAYLFVFKVY